jgi:hypothetical protein
LKETVAGGWGMGLGNAVGDWMKGKKKDAG